MGYSARRGFTNGKVSGAARQAELQQKIAQMQEQMSQTQEAVEAQEFTASVGGGVVEAKVNGKKDVASAIPVLDKIVKSYRRLQWDIVAGRYLAQAYLATGKPDAALQACQDIIATDSSAAYKGDLAPAYWSSLLALGKTTQLEMALDRAFKTGDRYSSGAAFIVRGDMIMKDGNESPDAARKALTDGYLRVVLLYKDEKIAPKLRPEALYKAARCFDKLQHAGRQQAMLDDLNCPIAIAHLFDAIKAINTVYDGKGTISADDLAELKDVFKTYVIDILGLKLEDNNGDNSADAFNGAIDLLLNIRQEAKANKDWATADKIRNQLNELGFSIKDGKDHVEWTLNK